MIKALARLDSVTAGSDAQGPSASGTAVVQGNEIFVPLAGAVDFESELARLDKEFGKLDKDLNVIEKKLSNKGFVSNAPAAVVEKEKAKLAEINDKKAKLTELKDRLVSVME